MNGIDLINHSLRCFWCSLIGLIPVAGLPLAVHAIARSYALRREAAGQDWNPGRDYQLWAIVFGLVGILISVAVVLAIATMILRKLALDA